MGKRLTEKDFIDYIEEHEGSNYTMIGTYINTQKKVLVRHNICGHEYEVTPTKFKSGRRCPNCNKFDVKKTHDDFCNEVEVITNGDYSVKGIYKGSNTKVSIKHNICGHEWDIKPTNFLSNGNRCPKCSKLSNISKGEKEIMDYLNDNNIKFHYNNLECCFEDCFSIRHGKKYYLPFDFYIPELNLVIEYDGKQHFEPWKGKHTTKEYNLHKFKLVQENDNIKNNFLLDSNLNSIRIKYTENVNNVLNEMIPLIKQNKKVQRLVHGTYTTSDR